MPSLQFLESLLNLKNIQSEAIEDLGFSIISNNSFNSHFVDVQTNRSNVSNKLLSTDAKPNINYLPLNIEEEKRMELIDKNFERALTTKQLASKTEENLYKKLLNPQNYEKNVRPTKHHLLPTNITFGVLLNQIVEMDERNQILTTRCWINVNWIDYRLSWNITQWEGINQIYAPHHRIWLPDIILINNAAHDYRGSLLSTDVSITNVGNVTWLLSALFKSNCAINVKYYPFDDQECTLKFASWGSHDSREIDIGLTTDQGDLSNYLNSTEFDLLSFKAERTLIRFSTDQVASWPMIIATIRMRRRPLFYVFNHIIPCVLISSMALLGFCMPPETGEKINMLNTVILSMGVYLQSIIESIPPTSETVPLIGIYYVASLAIVRVCLATAMNVYTLNVHRRGITNQSRVPWWMRKYILGYLATILLIRVHEPDSVTLIKATKTRRSTIRRISLLRDLKHIKNMENCKETRTDESKNCECMKENEEEKLPSSLNLKRRLTFADCSEDGCSPRIERRTNEYSNGRRLTQCTQESIGGECVTLEKMLMEQVMPRLNAVRPVMSAEFEERFRKILKRVYRSLQQFEIRDEVIDERKRIIWQWRTLASIIDRFLLFTFSFITFFTVTIFIIFPILFRERLLGQNEFIS
uniref:Neur_chan_LBD domain-containing protein n=1 Tax=Meloidogyne hapla TaxID=6305 RepID=A0A1I8BI26_MELHA